MSTYPIRTRRWTRREYHRLIELGILHEDEPIELLGGQLVVSEPKSSLHSTAVNTQDPIAADDESEPEPDVAVVSGSIRDYRDEHPANAALVVEVALSSDTPVGEQSLLELLGVCGGGAARDLDELLVHAM